MRPQNLKTKLFLDSGNPQETRETIALLGFLDGQTTNPSLVAKNPHIQDLKMQKLLNPEIIWDKYKELALQIHEILPNKSISVEVYSDAETKSESMIEKGRKLATWFPGVFVKLPITKEGLLTAEVFVKEGINVNMTLCFSQDQAAAVHSVTKGTKGQVYVSPFIGRLDDIGQEGSDIVNNILKMYKEWNSHVQVLGASIRNLDHLYKCLKGNTDIVTIPLSVIAEWKDYGLEKTPEQFPFSHSEKKLIQFQNLIEQEWSLYNIHHELTDKGIERFVSDWKSLFS